MPYTTRKKTKYLILLILLFVLLLKACPTGYQNDGKQVTYHSWNESSGHSILSLKADPNTFEKLGDSYARDNNNAFFEGRPIKDADGASFRYLGKQYAIDANHVFHYDTIMSKASPASFKVHSYYLTEDANDFYWNGSPVYVVDKNSFTVLGDINDYKTCWAKDKQHAYYMGYQPVPLADYESFKPLKPSKRYYSSAYATDKYNVYFKDSIIHGADPETFQQIDFYVGQDKYRTYYKWHATKIKDFNKLSKINQLYTDGTSIYDHNLIQLNNVDISSFRNIDNTNWYTDKNNVWWQGIIVKDADPNTFRPIFMYSFFSGEKEEHGSNYNYGKDAYHVFFRDSIIEGADPNTFEIIDFNNKLGWTIFDKNHIYLGKKSKELEQYLNAK